MEGAGETVSWAAGLVRPAADQLGSAGAALAEAAGPQVRPHLSAAPLGCWLSAAAQTQPVLRAQVRAGAWSAMLTTGTWFFSALKVVAYHHPLLRKEIIFEDPKDPGRPYELRRDKLCPDVAAPFLPNQKSENLGPYLDERCMVSSAPAPAPLPPQRG